MKKIIIILSGIILLIAIIYMNNSNKNSIEEKHELRAVFISYIEISEYLKDKNEESSKNNINIMINNVKEMNLNTIILHVRPAMDAIYYSETFPLSVYLTTTGEYPYDVLKYFVEIAHKNNIKLYAWINPYRIKTTNGKENIKETSPVYKYLDTDIVYENNGLFLNPAREESKELIIKGIKEVLEYDVDAIIFDDYFYPGEDVDKYEYEQVKDTISREEFQRKNVNEMLEAVYKECQNKKIRFGISPEGNIENNYSVNQADVQKWLVEDKYVDFIMPQIYFGFYNSKKPFKETAIEWNNLIINNKIDFYIALPFYKVGKTDLYAGEGKEEWLNNSDIIMKQIIISRNLEKYDGFAIYRYDNLFLEDTFTNNSKLEIKNVKKVLN